MANKHLFCGHPEYYQEHLREGTPTMAEMVAIAKDKRLPPEFLAEHIGELKEMREELERLLIEHG